MTDPRIVQSAIQGHQPAMERLYLDTYSETYALAYHLLRNEEDALDVVQEAYVSALTNLNRLHDPAKFDVWVKQIVSNRCKDHFRKKKPDLFSDLSADEEGMLFEVADEDRAFRPDEALDYTETKRLVQGFLEELPEEQRMCLLMFYGSEMTSKEIADALSVPESTVKSRLNYGKQKLKEKVSEYEETHNIRLHGAAPFAIFGFLRWMQSSSNVQPTIEAVSTVVQGSSGAASVASTVANVGSTAKGIGSAGKTIATIVTEVIKKGSFIMKFDKIRTTIIAIAAVVLAFLISLPFWISGGAKELSMKDYIKIEFSATEGVSASLRSEKLNALVSQEKMSAFSTIFLENPNIQNFSSLFSVGISGRSLSNPQNGDVLEVYLQINSSFSGRITFKDIEEHLGYTFDRTKLSVPVNGLLNSQSTQSSQTNSDPQMDNTQDDSSQIKQVDLSRIISVKFSGYNGYATPVASIIAKDEINTSPDTITGRKYFSSLISDALLERYLSTCSEEKKNALLFVDGILVDYAFKLEFETAYNNLSNGDTVKVRLVLQDTEKKAGITIEELEENLNLDFGSREYTVVVSGLEEAPKNAIDLFDGVLDCFEFTGTNESGRSNLELPEDYSRVIGDLYFKYDDHDTVKVIYQNKKIGTISYSVYDSEYIDACPVVSGKVAKISGYFHPEKESNGSEEITLEDLGYTVTTNHKQIIVPEIGEYLTDKSQLKPVSTDNIKTFISNDRYSGQYIAEVSKIYLTTLKPGVEMGTNFKSPMSITAIVYYNRSKYQQYYCFAYLYNIILKEDGSISNCEVSINWYDYEFNTIEEAEKKMNSSNRNTYELLG